MMRTMAGPLTVISLFWYGSAHWQVTPSLSLISFTNSHVLYFFISFIFSLFLHSNAANILMFLILIPWYLFSVHILFRLNSDLGALNDGGAIKGLEVREGDGVYITYADGADTVSKKLGNTKITFDISGSGDNPNYLSSAVFQFHRTSFDGFFAAGYKKCKIVFSSFSGTQSTGRLEIRKNGVTSTYYSNPGTVEFNLAKGDYIAGYVAEQATFRFGASVTMSG